MNNIKIKIFIIFIVVMFIGSLRAIEPILSKDMSNDIDKITVRDEIVKNESEELYKEIESLRGRLQEVETQNKQLEQSLNEYKNKEELQSIKNDSSLQLKAIISANPFNIKDVEDNDYNLGYQAVMFNNLEEAEKYLSKFIAKNLVKPEDEVENNSSFPYDQRALMLKNKAYYMLGYIKLINLKSSEALSDFAIAYKNSLDPNVVLLSLIKLLEIFDMLDKQQEVCLTIKRIYSTITQVQGEYSNSIISKEDLDNIQRFATKNKCSVSLNIGNNDNFNGDAVSNMINNKPFSYPKRDNSPKVEALLNSGDLSTNNQEMSNQRNNSNTVNNQSSLAMPNIDGKINNNFIDN